MGLYLLDYGAGNVQSLANSLNSLGHDFKWISHSDDFAKATVSFFFFFFANKFIGSPAIDTGRPWYFRESVPLMLLSGTSSLAVFLNHCEITFYLANPTSGFA